MTNINKVIKLIYDKKTGMVGFKIGPNFTVKTKSRKDFKFMLNCARAPPDGVISKIGGKKD